MEVSGITGEIWNELNRKTNSRYTNFVQVVVCPELIFLFHSTNYVLSIDGAWGVLQEDGHFNGIIGMLERNEADVGVTAFVILRSRSQVADNLRSLPHYE